jgi:hypothetical protein
MLPTQRPDLRDHSEALEPRNGSSIAAIAACGYGPDAFRMPRTARTAFAAWSTTWSADDCERQMTDNTDRQR